jgi:hypothetical protein
METKLGADGPELSRRRFLGGLTLGAVSLRAASLGQLPLQSGGAPAAVRPAAEAYSTNLDQLVVGYTSAESVNKGEPIGLHVSSRVGPVDLRIYRLGWNGGAGDQLVASATGIACVNRGLPTPAPTTGLIQCDWPASYTLETSPSWRSGVYLAVLHPTLRPTPSGYIPFVVRDDASDSPLVYQLATNTWQAYNNWGGKSIYDNASVGGRSLKVSFDRPYAQASGAGHLFQGDYAMIHWLEREGYELTYVTSVDTHRGRVLSGSRRAFMTVFHDEYWSSEQRNQVASELQGGKNFMFFSANSMYWRIRYEDAPDGRPARIWSCSKDTAIDPTTVRFRDAPLNDPENALLGSMYEYFIDTSTGLPLVAKNTTHWLYAGTGLRDGDQIPGMVGYEWDRVFDNGRTPPGLIRLSDSPVGTSGWKQETTIYTHASGGTMFNAASCYWCFPVNQPGWTVDERVRTMTRNLLAKLATHLPGPDPTTSTTPPTTTPTPALFGYQAIPPARLLDTRNGLPIGPEERRVVQLTGRAGIPVVDVAAVVANVTIVGPDVNTYLVALAAGTPLPSTSTVNSPARGTVANLAVIAPDAGGAIELYNAFGTTHVILDVVGWCPRSSYRPVSPSRVLDTRLSVPLAAQTTQTVQLAGRAGIPATGAEAVVVNLTLTEGTDDTYLVAYPAGANRPPTSAVNASRSGTVANLAIVPLGANGAINLLHDAGSAQVLVDVLGWIPTGTFVATGPQRAYDTRTTTPLVAGETRRFQISGATGVPATGVRAVAVNLTMTGTTQGTYLTAYGSGTTRPTTSSVNAGPGQTVANFAIVAVGGDGAIDMFNAAGSTHAIIDVVGYYPT